MEYEVYHLQYLRLDHLNLQYLKMQVMRDIDPHLRQIQARKRGRERGE